MTIEQRRNRLYRAIMRIDLAAPTARNRKLRAKLVEYLIRLDRDAGLSWMIQS